MSKRPRERTPVECWGPFTLRDRPIPEARSGIREGNLFSCSIFGVPHVARVTLARASYNVVAMRLRLATNGAHASDAPWAEALRRRSRGNPSNISHCLRAASHRIIRDPKDRDQWMLWVLHRLILPAV